MLAHVHVMKTAGQTIRSILRQSFAGKHCDLLLKRPAMAADLRWAQRLYGRLESIAGHPVVAYSDWQQAGLRPRYFTFLRDPVQRFVSHFQFSSQKFAEHASFEDWLAEFANYQTKSLSGDYSAQHAIDILEEKIGFVGLVERFNESLVLFHRWCNRPELDLRYRSVNVASDNRIKRDILADSKKVERIREFHKQDQIVFEYVRDVIYPRQVEKFGPSLAAAVAELEEALPGPVIYSFSQFTAAAKRNMLYKPLAKYILRVA